MRVLVLSTLFPPNVIGGAEVSAWNLARWLAERGHEVGVLTTAASAADVAEDSLEDGLRVWRVWMPRHYPAIDHFDKPQWRKAIWHLKDHFDRRNRAILGRVLDEFRPDFVNIHLLAGLGFNMLAELGARRIPAMFALHDLVLICLRSSMFKNGRECHGRCNTCIASSLWKRRMVAKVGRIGFYSPSEANLRSVAEYFPMRRYPSLVAPNANAYPQPTVTHEPSDVIRFLYVGRLHPTKGVEILLAAADRLAVRHRFTMTVVGEGPSGRKLRALYANRPWLSFTGQVSQEQVSNWMAASDVLCIPSIWAENSPGVAINALGRGLAIIGSDKGGIPELVQHEENGLLVRAGDITAWANALERILRDPAKLAAMRDNALQRARAFEPAALGDKLLGFMTAIRAGALPPGPVSATTVENYRAEASSITSG